MNRRSQLLMLGTLLVFLSAFFHLSANASTPDPRTSTPDVAPQQAEGSDDDPGNDITGIEYDPLFAEIECPFTVPWNQKITCGTLTVPENRSHPDSGMIDLFVAILKSSGKPKTDPVIVLPGGPGAAGSQSRSEFYDLPLRADRDLILIDPRGSGYSSPSLNCVEMESVGLNYDDTTQAYANCYDRLIQEGRDLGGYVTAEQVEDIADLAKVLGIGKFNLYATSYGTRVAALLADKYPSLVRSMVLDAVLPVSVNSLLEEPLNTYGVFQRVAVDCTRVPLCNGTYPALEARLLEVIDRYNRTPLPEDIGYGSGDDILNFLFHRLYSGGEKLPAFITALYDEDYQTACELLPPDVGCFLSRPDSADTNETSAEGVPISATLPITTPSEWRDLFVQPEEPFGPDVEKVTWLMQELEFDKPDALFDYLDTLEVGEVEDLLADLPPTRNDSFSEGLFAGVMCSEEAPFYTAADVEEIAARIPAQFGSLPVRRAKEVEDICEFWQVQPVSPARKVTLPSLVPALIVNGTHDPITPPVWARREAAYLDNSFLRLFPGYGHAVLSSGDPCMKEMMSDFYDNPTREPTAECFNELEVQFAVPDFQ